MTRSFSSKLPLSRLALDRDHLTRENPDLFEELWADPSARALVVYRGSALLSSPNRLALLPLHAVPDTSLRVYLGRTTVATEEEPAGTPVVAVQLDDAGHLAEAEWGDLRRLGATLSDRDAGLFVEALAILNWHDSYGFSPRSGTATVVEKGGWVRRDPIADREVFPRTDAAVIMGVIDADDRLLLGSNALWETNRYSLLAGFLEPGESAEAAVVREVFEEAGIVVTDPQYLGSQPWPFPASLMLGFTARVAEGFVGDVQPDGTEILDLRWFSRDELVASLDEITLPGRTSIARAIIEHWLGFELPE